MERAGQHGINAAGGDILRWPSQVVSAEELRRALNGHRELLLSTRAVITPSAAELLRGRGIRITREPTEARLAAKVAWGIAQERTYPSVASAVHALEREGLTFSHLPVRGSSSLCTWARSLAETVSKVEGQGAVLFCDDPGLVCCVANKVPALRAFAVSSVAEARRGATGMGANLVAVMPDGRTFFELRQMLRALCQGIPSCPADVARTLQELDGHAHR